MQFSLACNFSICRKRLYLFFVFCFFIVHPLFPCVRIDRDEQNMPAHPRPSPYFPLPRFAILLPCSCIMYSFYIMLVRVGVCGCTYTRAWVYVCVFACACVRASLFLSPGVFNLQAFGFLVVLCIYKRHFLFTCLVLYRCSLIEKKKKRIRQLFFLNEEFKCYIHSFLIFEPPLKNIRETFDFICEGKLF